MLGFAIPLSPPLVSAMFPSPACTPSRGGSRSGWRSSGICGYRRGLVDFLGRKLREAAPSVCSPSMTVGTRENAAVGFCVLHHLLSRRLATSTEGGLEGVRTALLLSDRWPR